MGKGHGTSNLSPRQSLCISLGLPAQKLLEFCPFGFLWRHPYIVMIDQVIGHWLIEPLAPLTFLKVGGGVGGVGLKVPVHCSRGWFSSHLATVLGCFPKVPSLNRPLYHSPLRKCWGLGSRESGITSGDQIHILMVKYVFLINHAVAVKSHGSVE